MRARLRLFCCVLLFSVLSLPALATKIPVGVMIYEGQTLDGSGVFHILLNPPAGLTFDKLTPSFFVDRIGHSFVLPPPKPSPPPLYDFLFLTVSGSGFGSCPCRSASLFGEQTMFNRCSSSSPAPSPQSPNRECPRLFSTILVNRLLQR